MAFTEERDIDLERVVIDPEYRRRVIVYLNARARAEREAMEARARVTPERQPRAA
jgi:hypothetical protein